MKCIKCGETRESEFYPSHIQNSDYRCKSCINEYIRPYTREYMRNHPEVNNATQKKWYKKNRETQCKRTLQYAQDNPQRHRAQVYACLAFPERQICEVEGCFQLGERHHSDYDKPYEVRWLCHKHHKELHRKYKTLIVL